MNLNYQPQNLLSSSLKLWSNRDGFCGHVISLKYGGHMTCLQVQACIWFADKCN